jgi:hypothetical protein
MSVYLKDHAPYGIYCKRCPGMKVYNCTDNLTLEEKDSNSYKSKKGKD